MVVKYLGYFTQGSKNFILKMFMEMRFSMIVFICFNFMMSLIYICMGTSYLTTYNNWGVYGNVLSTIIHTLIATLTLSIPKFIDEKIMLGLNPYLDFVLLLHMFLSYIFLGILISMVFRKLTRT